MTCLKCDIDLNLVYGVWEGKLSNAGLVFVELDEIFDIQRLICRRQILRQFFVEEARMNRWYVCVCLSVICTTEKFMQI